MNFWHYYTGSDGKIVSTTRCRDKGCKRQHLEISEKKS